MTSKPALLVFLFAGLICGVTWLSADEPLQTRAFKLADEEVDNNVLLKRIEKLEQRVTQLEQKLAQQTEKNPIRLIAPEKIQPIPRPDSPFLNELDSKEINGIKYYIVPLKEQKK